MANTVFNMLFSRQANIIVCVNLTQNSQNETTQKLLNDGVFGNSFQTVVGTPMLKST